MLPCKIILHCFIACYTFSIILGCRIIAYAGEDPVSGHRLLYETENNLPELAYDKSFLPGLQHSKHWNPEQCELRNANENRDGWGVGWYPSEPGSFPLRYRTSTAILDENNTTSPIFLSLLDG